jgi:hypothetical protein
MDELLARLRNYEQLWRDADFTDIADDLLVATDELEEQRAILAQLTVTEPDAQGISFVELRGHDGAAAVFPLCTTHERRIAGEWRAMLGCLPKAAPAASPRSRS